VKTRVWSPGFAIPIERDESGKVVRREDKKRRVWYVEFESNCGCGCCSDTREFNKHSTALRFAYHVAMGGDEWGFVA
jgi:hypothetical protein